MFSQDSYIGGSSDFNASDSNASDSGATGFATNFYGTVPQATYGTNVVNPLKGGKRKRGGTGLETLAVPATLLLANNTFKRKGYIYPNYKIRKSNHVSRRSIHSRRSRPSRRSRRSRRSKRR